MDTIEVNTGNRSTVINTLAVAGFVALVGAGIWLAVYSTRYVPSIVNRVGSAAVYLGSIFTLADEPVLSVIPDQTASTTISFGNASSTASASTTAKATTESEVKPATQTPGTETSGIYPLSGIGSTPTLSGLPDIIVTIDAVGYFATSSTDLVASRKSFVASSTVPAGFRPAVHFTIKNIGTNSTGIWSFNASIPTQSFSIYPSQPQPSLNPDGSIEYWLGFDYGAANKGAGQMISITANFDRTISESNLNNNSASATITIIGN